MTERAMLIRACLRVMVLAGVLAAGAQPVCAQSEDVEPRIIGKRGVRLLGMAGSLSRFFSSEQLFAGAYTVQVDVHHFVFNRVAIRFGAVGTGAFGGSEDEDSGAGIDGLEALGGALYYFTPDSIWSFYGGGEYRARVTNRLAGDAGSANAIAGLQGALSSRASFFVEGGWGMRLRRGDEDDLQTRIIGQAGVRFRF